VSDPNGFLYRLTTISGIIRDVGFPMAMVAIFVGWATGWIPLRPIDSMTKTTENLSASLAEHDKRVVQAQEARLAIDKSMAESIQRFTLIAERMERQQRLTYCLNTFKDPMLRRDCLQ
jgi:hypothetical protein